MPAAGAVCATALSRALLTLGPSLPKRLELHCPSAFASGLKQTALIVMLLGLSISPLAWSQDDLDSDDTEMQADADEVSGDGSEVQGEASGDEADLEQADESSGDESEVQEEE